MPNKNILLIEPGYKNKYPPLGLMKIAQYHGPAGKRDNVKFIKGEDRMVLTKAWDRIYVTTLFSFEFQKISESIDFAIHVANGHRDKVFVGGIAASLMYERFAEEPRWKGIRFIKGLLGQPPAVSLQLDEFSEELYSEDHSGKPIEDLIPDYSILNQVDYKYPVHDAYFTYASRGCIRKCSFCGVPKLEGDQREVAPITELIEGVTRLYGEKKDLILMDNNVVAAANFKEIIAEIRDLGFTKGATLKRGRTSPLRRVDFNQGVDARILCKDRMFLRELSTICIKPLRIAFDHLGLKKPYEQAIRYAHEFGLTGLSNYMLYNFHDTPADLYERMRLNVDLNEELKIKIWSFPMRYQPTDLPTRSHIGEHWTKYQLRSMQVILQATHGVVSGYKKFFNRAFGESVEDFENMLLRPHHYTFNRDWYEEMEGKPQFEDYLSKFNRLTSSEKADLLFLLSSNEPRNYAGLALKKNISPKLREIIHHYTPLTTAQETQIWEKQKSIKKAAEVSVPEDELVEDADLSDTLTINNLKSEPTGNQLSLL